MTPMSRTARFLRAAVVAALVAACAGPMPSASPTVETSNPTIEPTDFSSPMPSSTALATATANLQSPSPTAEPSWEPEPTVEGALPVRTEVEINPNVVDRAGVPADLYDTYWWTDDGDAGQYGTTAQIGLPAGERILTVVDGRVVSVRTARDKDDVLMVREFSTGSVIREIPSAMHWTDAVLVGRRLFWAGVTNDSPDPNAALDGGVWSTDITGAEAPIAIVAPGKALGGALCGRGMDVSPSGATLVATAPCIGKYGWTDVINVESRTRITRLRDTYAEALTDDTYVNWDAEPTDGFTFGMGGITARDLTTTAIRWRFPDIENVDRFLLNQVRAFGSSFVVESSWDTRDGTEGRFTIFNPVSGQHRLLLRQPHSDEAFSLDRNASSPTYVVLAQYSHPIRISGTPISIIRVADGALLRDAFVIDPPWLCSDEYCLRD